MSCSGNGEITINEVELGVIHNSNSYFVRFHGDATFQGLNCSIEASIDSSNLLFLCIISFPNILCYCSHLITS